VCFLDHVRPVPKFRRQEGVDDRENENNCRDEIERLEAYSARAAFPECLLPPLDSDRAAEGNSSFPRSLLERLSLSQPSKPTTPARESLGALGTSWR